LALVADLAFLAKRIAYSSTVDRFMRSRVEWISTVDHIGSLDASIAIAGFLHYTPRHCQPRVTDDALILIKDGYHPLLTHPVVNSIELDKQSALVTGSNMAGKTTFVKMIGTNIILGHTLGLCLASSATIPRSTVKASIRGEHSVESGKSRYFAEVETILGFIASASRGDCRVFVVDEPFSGTNTSERIAIAKAVLSSISEHAQLLVTTHDVELQELLTDRFAFFYFQEDPAVDGFFDYKLRPGVSKSRNAIRVLERMGFPESTIRDAMSTVAKTPAE
jgi:DNA mismatch repair ATPase MutS